MTYKIVKFYQGRTIDCSGGFLKQTRQTTKAKKTCTDFFVARKTDDADCALAYAMQCDTAPETSRTVT